MSFKISSDAKKMCDRINRESTTGKFEMWDFYYLCLMVGLIKMKMAEATDKSEFAKTFTSSINPFKHHIIGAIVGSELDRQGMDATKENIMNILKEVVDETANNKLSNHGLDLIDSYAEGGFRFIKQEYPSPVELSDFLIDCFFLINPDVQIPKNETTISDS